MITVNNVFKDEGNKKNGINIAFAKIVSRRVLDSRKDDMVSYSKDPSCHEETPLYEEVTNHEQKK